MGYHADPGGVFASDTHRRVLGHLPVPGAEPMEAVVDEPLTRAKELRRRSLAHRLSTDPNHGLQGVDELSEVLADLEADGYASQSKSGWKMTKKGLDALQAPVPERAQGPGGPALLDGLGGGDPLGG